MTAPAPRSQPGNDLPRCGRCSLAKFACRCDQALQMCDGKPHGSFCERFACDVVAKAIRDLAISSAHRCTCEFTTDDLGSPKIKICPTCSADREGK